LSSFYRNIYCYIALYRYGRVKKCGMRFDERKIVFRLFFIFLHEHLLISGMNNEWLKRFVWLFIHVYISVHIIYRLKIESLVHCTNSRGIVFQFPYNGFPECNEISYIIPFYYYCGKTILYQSTVVQTKRIRWLTVPQS